MMLFVLKIQQWGLYLQISKNSQRVGRDFLLMQQNATTVHGYLSADCGCGRSSLPTLEVLIVNINIAYESLSVTDHTLLCPSGFRNIAFDNIRGLRPKETPYRHDI